MDPLRLLPLGDSITCGTHGPGPELWGAGGYRTRLWQRLMAGGNAVRFVGHETKGPAEIDGHHQGMPGWQIDQLTAEVPEWVPPLAPDVVLLLAGTNDLIQGAGVEVACGRLGALLDGLAQAAPRAVILVGDLPTTRPGNAYRLAGELVAAYNAELPFSVAAAVARGARAVAVPVGSRCELGASGFARDGLHPDGVGYERLGEAWFAAVGLVVAELLKRRR